MPARRPQSAADRGRLRGASKSMSSQVTDREHSKPADRAASVLYKPLLSFNVGVLKAYSCKATSNQREQTGDGLLWAGAVCALQDQVSSFTFI